MTEAVEFEVPDAGAPLLGDGRAPEGTPDPAAEATALMVVPGWTSQEAARVVGGWIANVTLVMYAMKHRAPPAPELWPHIAGNPEQEFPLMGAGLAPVLDFLAPKGSAAAVGVNLSAATGELIGAMARRLPVINTPPPPKGERPAASTARAAEPSGPAAPPSDADGFRFRRDELRVLAQGEDPLMSLGIQ